MDTGKTQQKKMREEKEQGVMPWHET